MKCHAEHVQNSSQCPLCLKSINDMAAFNARVERLLEDHQMPEEYREYSSLVLCNDCGARSRCPYHFVYHKCMNADCGSFNTNMLQTYKTREPGAGLPDLNSCFTAEESKQR